MSDINLITDKIALINNKMDTDEIFNSNSRQSGVPIIPTSFSDRQKNLFEHLQKAEVNNKDRIVVAETPMDIVNATNKQTNKRKRSETKYFQGKESIFKRPEEPLSKCLPPRQVPDFRKNPNKWTKYTLDDVRSEDTSDRGNTAAALNFLRELEQRKHNEEKNEANLIDAKIKPRFNTTAIIRKKTVEENGEEEDKASFKGSKIVMPEYVIGQKKKTAKKNVQLKDQIKKIGKEIKLNHLVDEVEDED